MKKQVRAYEYQEKKQSNSPFPPCSSSCQLPYFSVFSFPYSLSLSTPDPQNLILGGQVPISLQADSALRNSVVNTCIATMMETGDNGGLMGKEL